MLRKDFTLLEYTTKRSCAIYRILLTFSNLLLEENTLFYLLISCFVIGFILTYFIEKMEIRGKEGVRVIKNPMIAISKGVISANEKYQMILQPEILKYGGIEYDI